MNFQTLFDFITRHMRMSHVYQPVMLMELLCSGGAASTSKIAKAILGRDDSQIEYYEKITRDMVGRVLKNRGVVSKQGKDFLLNGYASLSPDEITSSLQLVSFDLMSTWYSAGKGSGSIESYRLGTSLEPFVTTFLKGLSFTVSCAESPLT